MRVLMQLGMRHYNNINGGRLIAIPEKGLCDTIRYDSGIGRITQEVMNNYLHYDLRLDGIEKLSTKLGSFQTLYLLFRENVNFMCILMN
jgi:hypothetical protein